MARVANRPNQSMERTPKAFGVADFILVILASLATSTIRPAVANPIAIDLGEPISLIAESVDIAIHENQSVVSGTYSFRKAQGQLFAPDDGILIYVPIIVHGPQSFASLKLSTAVSLTIGRRVLHPSRASVASPPYGLPSGWKLYNLVFEIPRRPLRFHSRCSLYSTASSR
jgi:hypothetical protein